MINELFRKMTVAQIFSALSGTFQGIRVPWFTNLIAFMESFFLVVCSWLLGKIFGLPGFWIGAICGQAATFAVISLLVWKKYGMISFSADAFCYLEPEFGVDPSDCMTFSITGQKKQSPENDALKRQYGKYFLVSVLSFYAALTVEKSESRIWTVDQIHYQQLKKEISCFLLLIQNKGLTPLWRQPLFRSVYQFAQKS